MPASDYQHEAGQGLEPAHGGAGFRTPGKSTVSGKLAGGKTRSVEEKLEALEEQNDTILVAFAPYLARHMTKPDAPEAATIVRSQLMELRALADDLKRSKSAAKRKGLESAVNDALTAAEVTMLTQGALVARLLDNGDVIKASWNAKDAFGVHLDAKERDPEPEMDPAPKRPHFGVPIVDDGFLCEREGAKKDEAHNCEATKDQRHKLHTELGDYVGLAVDAMYAACDNVTLEEVLATEEGWSAFCEFAFYAVTGPLIGQAIKGLGLAKKAVDAGKLQSFSDIYHGVPVPKHPLGLVANLDDKTVTAILTNASRALRTKLKHAFKSEGSRHKVEFVEMFKNQIGSFAKAIKDQALTSLDDADLADFVRGYRDTEVHGVAAYEETIRSFANRYVAQDVPKIGVPQFGNRTLRLVKLVAFGYERMATLEEDTEEHHPKRTPEGNRTYFHDFVDDEFAGAARDFQTSRRGLSTNTIDVTHGYFFAVHETPKDGNDQRWMNERNYTGMIPKLDALDAWIAKCRRRAEADTGPEGVGSAPRDEKGAIDEPEDVDFEYREQQGTASS